MVIRADLSMGRMGPLMWTPQLPFQLPFPIPMPNGGQSGFGQPNGSCGCAAPSQGDSFGTGGAAQGYGGDWASDPFVMLAQMAEMMQRLMQLAQLSQQPGGLANILSQMMQQPGRDLGGFGNLGGMGSPLSNPGRAAFSNPGLSTPDLSGARPGDVSGPGRLNPGEAVPQGTNTRGVQRYAPGSQEARDLFRQAARNAGLPESWADSPGLHNILRRESDGQVGRPNYTYGARARDPSQWASIHDELKAGRKTTRSSATGLGQLLFANVDKYYPSGRAGIGDPLEEATGMLRYIADRYGSPDNAWAQYGRRHEGY